MRQLRPYLYFGPSVLPVDLPRLRRAGITAVLSLQEPGVDLSHAAVERMRAACAPDVVFTNIGIRDYDPDAVVAALPVVLASLHALIAGGRVVYVHCSEGIARSPSTVLAYLVRHEGLDVDRALAEIERSDAGAAPYAAVANWLRTGS